MRGSEKAIGMGGLVISQRVYYDVIEKTAVVFAVLELRRNPRWIATRLKSRAKDS